MSEFPPRNDEKSSQKEECPSDAMQSDMAHKETEVAATEQIEAGQSSLVNDKSDDIDTSPNGKRTSESSYGTENSVLSSHQSLQALQALNSVNTQESDETRSVEEIEIGLYDEQGPLNDVAIEEDDHGSIRECDSSCSSPLLNGHVIHNDVHIPTEKPQETHSGTSDKQPKENRRYFSLFCRKSRTSPSKTNRSNGDVIINVDVEEISIHESPRPKSKCYLNDRLKGWFQPMDNKMNMKVFGSRRALADELVRYSEVGWIIHPTSAFRSYCQQDKLSNSLVLLTNPRSRNVSNSHSSRLRIARAADVKYLPISKCHLSLNGMRLIFKRTKIYTDCLVYRKN